MFVKFVKGALVGDTWRFPGTVMNVEEAFARSLLKSGVAKLDAGPAVDGPAVPEEGVIYYGAKPEEDALETVDPSKRGPGRPKKEA